MWADFKYSKYAMIRTIAKPQKYRSGQTRTPRIYTIGQARGLCKPHEEIVPIKEINFGPVEAAPVRIKKPKNHWYATVIKDATP